MYLDEAQVISKASVFISFISVFLVYDKITRGNWYDVSFFGINAIAFDYMFLWLRAFYLQWFGNIVTMDWWDDLWLNEGFASFFEYVGVEKAEPSWGMVSLSIYNTHKKTCTFW